MFCRQLSYWIVQLATAAFLLGGGSAFALDGPSFDCHGVRQTLAVILCSNVEAAQADCTVNWRLVRSNRAARMVAFVNHAQTSWSQVTEGSQRNDTHNTLPAHHAY